MIVPKSAAPEYDGLKCPHCQVEFRWQEIAGERPPWREDGAGPAEGDIGICAVCLGWWVCQGQGIQPHLPTSTECDVLADFLLKIRRRVL